MAVIAAVASVLSATAAWSEGQCSHFEQQVFEAAQAVAAFQRGEKFIEYGWSAGGPYSGWLKVLQKLRDDPQNVRLLMVEYGFTPMDIYNVANEYRSNGALDSFYADTERAIRKLECG